MASLTIDSGTSVGKCHQLKGDALLLGRAEGCDIVLPDDTVSRQHARILRRDDGYYLEDLQSRNGTFVNGRRVTSPARLRDGDTLRLYDVTATFNEGIAASERPAVRSSVWLSHDQQGLGTTTVRTGATVAEIDLSSPNHRLVDDRADVRLQAVLDVSRDLRSCVDLTELHTRVLDCLLRIFPQLELACVLKLDSDRGQLLLDAVRSRKGSDPETAGPIMQSIVRQAFADGKALLSVDAVSELGVEPSGSVHDTAHRCVMCAPLFDSLRSPMGALYLDTGDELNRFAAADLDVLACVALLTSHAVEQATLQNARYRAAVNLSTDAIITFNAHGKIESVNPAAIDLFGYGSSDLRNVNVRDLAPELAPLVADGDCDASAAVLTKFRRSTESIARRGDGSTFPSRLSIGELRLGELQLFTASIHDITEQKRVEQSLQRSNEELEKAVELRTSYILLHQDVASIANQAETVPLAFQAALDRIRETTGWPVGHVFVRSKDGPPGYVDAGVWSTTDDERFALLRAETEELRIDGSATRIAAGRVISSLRASRAVGESALAADTRAAILSELDLQNIFAFPVFVGDDVAAVMEFFAPTADSHGEGIENVMAHVGMQLGRVMERLRLHTELVDAVWDQQRNFGQELHDSIGQELAALGLLADSLSRKLKARGVVECRAAVELAQMIQHAKQDVRRLAKGLLPVEVDADGLKAALEELAEATELHCGIPVDLWCDEFLQLEDNSVATHLFRIAQEAVTNAVRHANARHLAVRFVRTNQGDVELSVSDDGDGMPDRRRPGQGVGLQIMKYRAQAIGAEFEIHPGVGGGTVVVCRLQGSSTHVSENGRRTRQSAHCR